MERERDASQADLAEQDEPSEDELTEVSRDAGEADVLDQHRAARPGDEPDAPTSIPADVPEADALEQARSVPADEDERDD
jgi:hypothetical protein